MNNLKRVLSLVMSGAMLVGMLTVGASAANTTFTDKDEITHTEAVNTMAALGVIKGKDTGAFDPKGNVTRAEMAKIICVMLNGGEDPAWGTDIKTTFTDTQTHWAKNYIAYCANKGVIAGQGDGTFNPDGNVTGAQAAKMMLVALDYDPDIFKLVGAKWEDNTNAIASEKGLYKSIRGLNTSAALNRDDAAQMAYNCLEAKPMKKSFESIAADGEITYKYEEGAQKFLAKYFEADVFVGRFEGNHETLSSDSTMKEGMIAVKGALEDDYVNADDNSSSTAKFYAELDIANVGEEVKVLFYDKDNDGKPGKNDVIYGAYNAGTTEVVNATVAKIKDKGTASDGEVKIGDDTYKLVAATGDSVDFVIRNYGAKDAVKVESDGSAQTDLTAGAPLFQSTEAAFLALKADKGDPIKVILDGDGKISKVYLVESVLGTVTAVSSDKVTISGLNKSIKIADNEVYEGIAKNDVVVTTQLYDSDASKATVIVEKAEKISGEVKGYKDDKSQVTLDGTNYKIYGKTTLPTSVAGKTDFEDAFEDSHIGEDFDLYLVNGYVAAARQTSESANNYSMVVNVGTGTAGDELNPLKIVAMATDGTKTTLTVNDDGDTSPAYGDIVTYTVGSDGTAKVKVEKAFASALTNGKSQKVYDKTTKTAGYDTNAIVTAADCTLIYVNAYTSLDATKEYKTAKIRDMKDITFGANDLYAIVEDNDKAVLVAMYVADTDVIGVSSADTLFGMVIADNGSVKVGDDVCKSYTLWTGEETPVYLKDNSTTLTKGKIYGFVSSTDNKYTDNTSFKDMSVNTGWAVTGLDGYSSSGSVAAVGIKTYDAEEQLIVYHGVNSSTGKVDTSTTTTKALDDDVKIIYVNGDDDAAGEDIGISSYNAVEQYANAMVMINNDGLVDVIMIETSGSVNIQTQE